MKYIFSKSGLLRSLFVLTIITNLFALSNVTFSQGRRDWDILHGNEYNPGDTTQSIDTTLTAIDSTKLLKIDSTAAERFFTYSPEYNYGVKVNQRKHPLILGDASSITYSVSFDSTGNVVIRKQLDGEDILVPRVITFDEYIAELSLEQDKVLFEQIVAETFQGQTQDDLSELFEKFTDITIPLPFKSETIFGPPTFNLRINGSIDITASYEKIESDQEIVSALTSSQNNINFKQQVYVTAKGTVGDKLTIDADWNTERVFDFENQLKILYEGYPDEVIRKIEAGNVSLETNSSLIQSTQALFGVKGEFQLGPLTLTTVVSQKKSKQEEKDYVGGAQQQEINIPAYEYDENHFFLDTLYKASFLDYYNNPDDLLSPTTINQSVIVYPPEQFEVWVQTDNSVQDFRFAVATTMLYERGPNANGYDQDTVVTSPTQVPGIRFAGLFRKLDPSEYYVNPEAGFISLKTQIPPNYHVAVAYQTKDNKYYGTRSFDKPSDQNLILKMVKVKDQSPDQTPLAWELLMKNIYRLPVSKIIESGFRLEVRYLDENIWEPNLPGQSVSLSTMLDIDRYTGKQKSPPADNIFDFFPGYTINTETGDIIFPTLRPFWDNLDSAGISDTTLIFSDIYTKRKSEVRQNSPLASKYALIGSAKGEAGISNTINLGFNVVQGSVRVLIGEQELQNNIDYSVDYVTGTVTIKNASALLSNDLKVKYETNDLFQLASKTLIGARGVYKLGEESSLGFTFMNLKQETLNDKVRLGEEPTNNSVFGVDFQTNIKSKFLTNIVNMLPGFNTKDESSFVLKGEFAYLLPDPNTKRSRIPSDNNESIAYVDDMEGAKKLISLGTNYSAWTLASLPLDSLVGINDMDKQSKRGKFLWYNLPNAALVKDIYPLRDVQAGQESITPLIMRFIPSQRGMYNYYQEKVDSLPEDQMWGGMMRYLNTTSTDLLSENINFIEFNMKIDSTNASAIQNGKLVIDLGDISEDAIPNGKLDTEDKNNNSVLELSEDIGLDYKTNAEEKVIYDSVNSVEYNFQTQGPDPGLDDNNESGQINLDIINGTQNNHLFEGGNRPDTEDLDRNGTMDGSSSYFQYEVSLDTTNNPNISGRGAPGSGWFQYRIPLSEFVARYGDVNFTRIEYARVWVKGVDETVKLVMVDFNLTGNQWYKPNKQDTTYSISVVSIEENPQIYQSPVPGNVLRQEIRNTTGANTLSNEQSLSLNVNNLQNGQRKIALKEYRTVPLDLFNYKSMKLFVNGDPSFNYTDENIFDAWMVVRIGTDSNNFYEYRAPVHPDIRPGSPWNSQNEVTINFADLTAIKIARDTSAFSDSMFVVPNGPPGSFYRVKGNPAITSIREIALGVEKNRNSYNAAITGSVWFNEIRVLNVNDDPGYAFNVTAGVNLANLLALNFTLGKTSPNFFNLDGRFGNRQTGLNWDFSATLNVHRFFNNFFASWFSEEWTNFLNIPLTFRHTESMIDPTYYPGTDIDINKAAQERYNQVFNQTGGDVNAAILAMNNLKIQAQTLEVVNQFGVNGMTFKIPGNNYFVDNILNRFEFNFNGNIRSRRDVSLESSDRFEYNGGVNFTPDFDLADNYNLSIGRILDLGDEYKDAKMYFALPFLPLAPLFSKGFTGNINFNRYREENKLRNLDQLSPISRTFDAERGFNFDWKFIEGWIVDLSGNYTYKVGSDLRPFETYNDSIGSQRPESEVLNSIFFNDALINFGRDYNYAQTNTFNPKFNIPYLKKFLDVTMGYSVTYYWSRPNTVENTTGYNVRYDNSVTSTANLKLNEIFALFKPSDNKLRGRIGGNTDDREGQNIFDIFKIFTSFVPDAISVSLTQTNTRANPSIQGNPGFGNFWLALTANEEAGPSRGYQLGFSDFPGRRIANLAGVTDQFGINNNVTFSTTIKPIFPEAIRMNLSFKSRWGFTNTNTYTTNNEGFVQFQTNKSNVVNNAHSIFFTPDIEDFEYALNPDQNENIKGISNAFESGLASFPFPNWNMTITGVEKFPFFGQFASSVTIENNFESEYSKSFSVNNTDIEIPSAQEVKQSFTPLFGINMTFKEAFSGNLTASFKYNTAKILRLIPTSNLITASNNSDWSVSASYSKAGFEIPFFGLSLQNDIAFSLSVTKTNNEPIDYRFTPLSTNNKPERLPGNGSSVFTINPSIQYSLSSKVQMQLFYKYIRTEPTEQTVTTVPRTSNEGGLNIRISIQ